VIKSGGGASLAQAERITQVAIIQMMRILFSTEGGTNMELREGETVGDYVMRLERRLQELEPPEGFTIQEWHVGQVYTYLLWRDTDAFEDEAGTKEWSSMLSAFEARFHGQVKKFADYMGWNKKQKEEPTDSVPSPSPSAKPPA
jgi:hypothetical protein